MIAMACRIFRKTSRHTALRINSLVRYLAVGLLLVFCAVLRADANGDEVEAFLQDFQKRRGEVATYSARFMQKKTLAIFDERKSSSGMVLYKAPGVMLWKYEQPDRTQMRMDRKTIAFYFPALEQIEIYDTESGEGNAAFFFAFEASADELQDEFEISVGDADGKERRVELVPKDEPLAAQILGITLWLRPADYLPQRIMIQETSGDTTDIELSEIRVNEPIEDNELQFDAPEGTEIIKTDPNAF
jgi:outer membrane lipoprotein carrier protein